MSTYNDILPIGKASTWLICIFMGDISALPKEAMFTERRMCISLPARLIFSQWERLSDRKSVV